MFHNSSFKQKNAENSGRSQINSNNSFNKQLNRLNSNSTTEELIRITIDLGDGVSEDIIVQRGEEMESDMLARRFCLKHGFDEKIQQALSIQIHHNI